MCLYVEDEDVEAKKFRWEGLGEEGLIFIWKSKGDPAHNQSDQPDRTSPSQDSLRSWEKADWLLQVPIVSLIAEPHLKATTCGTFKVVRIFLIGPFYSQPEICISGRGFLIGSTLGIHIYLPCEFFHWPVPTSPIRSYRILCLI